jgi:thymidylate kinase
MVVTNNNRPMLIILEGPECTGKSTVARKLAEDFGARVQKGVRIADRFLLMSSTIRDLENQVLRTSGLIGEAMTVFDRWPAISDCIYERYIVGGNPITYEMLPFFRDLFVNNNVQLVFLNVNKDTMIQRFQSRGDNIVDLNEAVTAYDAYQQFFSDCAAMLPCFIIDASDLSEDETYSKVKGALGLDSEV